MENAEFWVQVISNNGFAMALTIYLLTSNRKTMEDFRKTLDEQRNDFKSFVNEITHAMKELRKGNRE
ncbi:MAG: hypothetical protein WDZ91_08480 [Paenibacillaceae bacterium]